MGIATVIQRAPKGRGTPITELLIADLQERQRMGIAKYGEALMAFNGRDALVDAYQELIDLLVYLRQSMEEIQQIRISIQSLLPSMRDIYLTLKEREYVHTADGRTWQECFVQVYEYASKLEEALLLLRLDKPS